MTGTKNKTGTGCAGKHLKSGAAGWQETFRITGIKRNYLNYLIDTAVLICGSICAVTGVVKWPGLVYAMGLSYQSLPMEALTLLHDWTGLLIIGLLALHLLLHRKWMATMTRKVLKPKGGKNETP